MTKIGSDALSPQWPSTNVNSRASGLPRTTKADSSAPAARPASIFIPLPCSLALCLSVYTCIRENLRPAQRIHGKSRRPLLEEQPTRSIMKVLAYKISPPPSSLIQSAGGAQTRATYGSRGKYFRAHMRASNIIRARRLRNGLGYGNL